MSISPLAGARRRENELMDDPALEAAAHAVALAGLARINALSRSAQVLWRPLRRLAAQLDRPLRVLDAATGAGDVPIRIHALAQRAGVALDIEACDISPRALDFARARAERCDADIRFFRCDVLAAPLDREYDVVMSSLFLHHLDEAPAIQMLRALRCAARRLVLIHDLRRSTAAWLFTWSATRLITRSPIVHVDGPRSVRAAFTMREAADLAESAGLRGARVTRRWPLRFLLEWWRS